MFKDIAIGCLRDIKKTSTFLIMANITMCFHMPVIYETFHQITAFKTFISNYG